MEILRRCICRIRNLLDLNIGIVTGVIAIAVSRGSDDFEAADREIAVISLHDGGEVFEHRGGALVVGIHEYEVASARPVDCEVARCRCPAVWDMESSEARVLQGHAIENRPRFVVRSVVNDDDLNVCEGLVQDGANGRLDVRLDVVGGNDDRYQGIRLVRCDGGG